MKIDYLGHSGFFVETESAMLLFDYCRGDLSFIEDKTKDKPLFVLSSHAHADHFTPAIFDLARAQPNTKYLLSFDIEKSSKVPSGFDIEYLDADRTYQIAGLGEIKTLVSTDEGIAFLIKTYNETLFHAGDLNWWDWPGEDAEWLKEQEIVFRREIMKIAETPIDAAFIVFDDRLEENYAKGAELFLGLCRAKYVFPMHFWKDKRIVERFIKQTQHTMSNAIILDTAEEKHWEF